MSFDILIQGGSIIDGTGAAETHADIAIRGDRIEAIGKLNGGDAHTIVDANGKTVCPGFIDAHSHSDAYLLIEPSSPSKLYQGITTEVIGNCGASAAPLVGQCRMPSDWEMQEYPENWQTLSEYCDLLRDARPAPNVLILVGHNTLRRGVVGYENRPVTKDELRAMCMLAEQTFDQGAAGLSTGLIYAPGSHADREELAALLSVVGKRGGIYTTHMRSEGRGLLESLAETFSLCREAQCRCQDSRKGKICR